MRWAMAISKAMERRTSECAIAGRDFRAGSCLIRQLLARCVAADPAHHPPQCPHAPPPRSHNTYTVQAVVTRTRTSMHVSFSATHSEEALPTRGTSWQIPRSSSLRARLNLAGTGDRVGNKPGSQGWAVSPRTVTWLNGFRCT